MTEGTQDSKKTERKKKAKGLEKFIVLNHNIEKQRTIGSPIRGDPNLSYRQKSFNLQ